MREGGEVSDLIPWGWSLNFQAIDCSLQDELSSSLGFGLNRSDNPPTIEDTQHIEIQLRADHGGNSLRRTRYSMFGTSREIEDIWLMIFQLESAEDQEFCNTWRSVSYTAEVDFRSTRAADTLGFRLVVKPGTFDRFVATIRAGNIDSITFRVGSVAGFYSHWSPGISTTSIKILTADKEQNVEAADEIEPPRLGNVGEFGIYFNRRLDFEPRAQPAGGEAALPSSGELPATVRKADPEATKLLKSIRTAAWYVVAILAALAIKALAH